MTSTENQATARPWIFKGQNTIVIGHPNNEAGPLGIYPEVARIELTRPAVYSHFGKHNGKRQRIDQEDAKRAYADASLIVQAVNEYAVLCAVADAAENRIKNQMVYGHVSLCPCDNCKIKQALAALDSLRNGKGEK